MLRIPKGRAPWLTARYLVFNSLPGNIALFPEEVFSHRLITNFAVSFRRKPEFSEILGIGSRPP
jgi:hypothetical protein